MDRLRALAAIVSWCLLPASVLASEVPLEDLIPVSECAVEKSSEGLVLRGFGYVRTPKSYSVPLKIEAVAKTDSTNLRLHYAKGHVIFNWEANLDVLAMYEPVYGHSRVVKKSGRIPFGEWVKATWIIENDRLRVLVNDELRFDSRDTEVSETDRQDYRGLVGPACIGPAWGSTVILKSLNVSEL